MKTFCIPRKGLLALVLLGAAGAAQAHVGHEGGHAATFLSGLAHPVSGMDHLLAMVAVGAAGYWSSPLTLDGTEGLLTSWSNAAGGPLQQPMLSAMVVAQCLHYHFVIKVLPTTERQRTGQHPLPHRVRRWAIVVSAILAGYFVHDYDEARQLYAVAAGLHAWIEWPILLMTLLAAPSARQTDAARAINSMSKNS